MYGNLLEETTYPTFDMPERPWEAMRAPSDSALYILGRHTIYVTDEALKAEALASGLGETYWLNIEDFWRAAQDPDKVNHLPASRGTAALNDVLNILGRLDRACGLPNSNTGLHLRGYISNDYGLHVAQTAKLGWDRTSFLLSQDSALIAWELIRAMRIRLRKSTSVLTRVLFDQEILDFDVGNIEFRPN